MYLYVPVGSCVTYLLTHLLHLPTYLLGILGSANMYLWGNAFDFIARAPPLPPPLPVGAIGPSAGSGGLALRFMYWDTNEENEDEDEDEGEGEDGWRCDRFKPLVRAARGKTHVRTHSLTHSPTC